MWRPRTGRKQWNVLKLHVCGDRAGGAGAARKNRNWLKLSNGCGDRGGEQNNVLKQRSGCGDQWGRQNKLLKLRSGRGDQGEGGSMQLLLKLRTCCDDQGSDNKEQC